MDDSNELQEARHEVLAENTAQAVHKHLNKLLNGATRYRKRWVWELLQNARDAASSEGVNVKLVYDGKSITFTHDGIPFTRKSIAHLIYHGSTKHDLSDPVGHFGTGFISTHLLSRCIHVTGELANDGQFSFELDRSGNTADELAAAMDASWTNFVSSLTSRPIRNDQFTTGYLYAVKPELDAAIREGIDDLTRNAPYVLAFNPRISSIETVVDKHSTLFSKNESVDIADRITRVTIGRRADGSESANRYIAVAADIDVSVAVEIAANDDGWEVLSLSSTPRIFVAFPLSNSEEFSLPLVIHSLRLEPSEDRDSLELNGDSTTNIANMEFVKRACALTSYLATFAGMEGWRRAVIMARIPEFREREWLNASWFRSTVREQIVEPLRYAGILVSLGASRIPPRKSRIPLPSDNVGVLDVWEVARSLECVVDLLPVKSEVERWSDNLLSWAAICEVPPEHFEEHLSLFAICKFVSSSGSVAELQKSLRDREAIDWLKCLYQLVVSSSRIQSFDDVRLLPNQNGKLMFRKELKVDNDIEEELKTIAATLGVDVRARLLDRRIDLATVSNDLERLTNADLLDEALESLTELSESEPTGEQFRSGSVALFGWLMRHNELDRLEGFPVYTSAIESDTVWQLESATIASDNTPLSPIGSWPMLARPFAALFPRDSILNEGYFAVTDESGWRSLASRHCVRAGPLYMHQKPLDAFLPDEPLPEKEDKGKKVKHQTKSPVLVSALAFFEQEGSGLDAIRKSKLKAVDFMRFVLSYLLEADTDAFRSRDAECECGDRHHYFGASWLIPMCNRKWVPLGEGKGSLATAESLAQLAREDEKLLAGLTNGTGRQLLTAMGISLADLLLRTVADDEAGRVAYIGSLSEIARASGHDPEKAQQIVAELSRSRDLVNDILERRGRRETVRRNQAIGAAVEAALKYILETRGLKVKRQPIGSDFEVESDIEEDELDVVIEVETDERSFLVEVKATRANVVRMTVTQARTATEQRHRFALCMVMLDGDDVSVEAVSAKSRFVFDIGERLGPVWEEFQRFEETKAVVTIPTKGIELLVNDAETRFAIDETVWREGLSLEQAAERFERRKE